MAEPTTETPAPIDRCPWCSAPLPMADLETCPSCGATLTSTVADQLPGVTTLDTEAILRARSSASRPRSRLLSFITGETGEDATGTSSPESLAPPSEEVRREMLRLEIAAEVADLEAEVHSLETEARLEAGQPLVVSSEDESPIPAEELSAERAVHAPDDGEQAPDAQAGESEASDPAASR